MFLSSYVSVADVCISFFCSILTVPKTQKWLFVSDVETRLNVTKLLHSLSSYNHDEVMFNLLYRFDIVCILYL